jgi:hypothetical protein
MKFQVLGPGPGTPVTVTSRIIRVQPASESKHESLASPSIMMFRRPAGRRAAAARRPSHVHWIGSPPATRPCRGRESVSVRPGRRSDGLPGSGCPRAAIVGCHPTAGAYGLRVRIQVSGPSSSRRRSPGSGSGPGCPEPSESIAWQCGMIAAQPAPSQSGRLTRSPSQAPGRQAPGVPPRLRVRPAQTRTPSPPESGPPRRPGSSSHSACGSPPLAAAAAAPRRRPGHCPEPGPAGQPIRRPVGTARDWPGPGAGGGPGPSRGDPMIGPGRPGRGRPSSVTI